METGQRVAERRVLETRPDTRDLKQAGKESMRVFSDSRRPLSRWSNPRDEARRR
jgi:hypothetical protein